MDLNVTSEAIEAMQRHALRAAPHEACGLLFGSDGSVSHALAATNVHARPATRFEIDPRTLIDAHRATRDGGPRIAGYYHSHPNGVARPSASDREGAAGDGLVWAIVAGGAITFWRDDPGGFVPLSYRLAQV